MDRRSRACWRDQRTNSAGRERQPIRHTLFTLCVCRSVVYVHVCIGVWERKSWEREGGQEGDKIIQGNRNLSCFFKNTTSCFHAIFYICFWLTIYICVTLFLLTRSQSINISHCTTSWFKSDRMLFFKKILVCSQQKWISADVNPSTKEHFHHFFHCLPPSHYTSLPPPFIYLASSSSSPSPSFLLLLSLPPSSTLLLIT